MHPDEFTASKTPSYPSLRMALSVASHMGWPVECWDVSTAFLYARLLGDRDTNLGGNEIYMRPPRILVETKVVADGVVWKIKKALYGLRTSPIAWETERDKILKEESHDTPEGDAPEVMQMTPASRTKSRLLKNQRVVIRNKMPLHPAAIQLQRRRPNLSRNRMRLGLFVSQMKDKTSCGTPRPQLCVQHF